MSGSRNSELLTLGYIEFLKEKQNADKLILSVINIEYSFHIKLSFNIEYKLEVGQKV